MWLLSLALVCSVSLGSTLGSALGSGPGAEASLVRDDLAPATFDLEDRALYQGLVADLARAAATGTEGTALSERAAALGFSLVDGEGMFELRPMSHPAGAAGLLLLRKGPLPAEVIVAAPHPFDDLRTGAIARSIFAHAPVRGLYIASQSRRAHLDADPAHNPLSALQLSTEALALVLDQAVFVQVHGFGPGHTEADAVVAGGASGTSALLLTQSEALLRAVLQGAEVRSAHGVPQLAARSNVQGRSLRGRGSFVHIELGATVRRSLAADPAACRRIGAGLVSMAS